MTATERPTDPRVLASTQLLRDLIDNPLDPGYAAAARRRPQGARRPGWATPLVAVMCALIGFLLVTSYVSTHRGAPAAARAHTALVARARSAQQKADALNTRLDQLNGEVDATRNRALPQSGALADQLAADSLAGSQRAVTGPGITVTLADPPAPTASPTAARGGSVPIETTNTLTDRDVLSVVNELWHDGAEAIAVNGIRLTPTSTIRFAGEAVLVDYQPISSPYRIAAIGGADAMSVAFAQSPVASRYQTLKGVEGITFTFDEEQQLNLPAGTPTTLRYAKAGAAPR